MNTEQERAELLPCPFCGCAMSLSAVARDWWRITGGHNEDCILYDHRHDAPQTDYQKQALIEDWNRRAALQSQPAAKFRRGDRVRKLKGSNWQGRVVGTYSTSLTPEGYAVESDTEHGSVQIYPAAALGLVEGQPVEIAEQPADPDAERYRKFIGAGLPITYLGEDYHDKDSLDAAIDATGEP